MSRLVTCPPHYYIKICPWILFWIPFCIPFWIPFWIPLLDPLLNPLLCPHLEPLLEPLLDANGFLCNNANLGNSISNMGMLVTSACYYSGNPFFGGVTIRDMSLNEMCLCYTVCTINTNIL